MEIFAALLMGFIGSFHCVAMCGAIALGLRSSSSTGIALRQVFYHVGRISVYVLLGALFGSLHAVAFINRGQNVVSLVLGSVVFLTSLILLLDIGPSYTLNHWGMIFISRLRRLLVGDRDQAAPLTAFAVGAVNGFLPCGFVYFALASALMQSSTGQSMLFMALFGLGTVPSLAALVLLSKLPKIRGIFNSRRSLSVASAIAGLVLVIRGLALGIPYLSPQLPDTVQVLSDIKHEQVCGSPKTR